MVVNVVSGGSRAGGRLALAVLGLAAVIACGQIEPAPTAPTPTGPAPTRSGGGTPAPAPSPAPTPAPTPTPAPAPAPAPAAGRIEVAITPNPVPFSGQPITDIASCRDRPNTWFYDQVLREVGGAAVTITERVDMFDGAVTSRSNPNVRIAAGGTHTIRTRWCSVSSSAHTAQTNFSGTDANGRAWSLTGPVVRLQSR